MSRAYIAAISGIKNSGKTTFLENLVEELIGRGYQTAVIKHDGHEFEADVPGTDTYRMQKAGAYGTAIFSKGQWMMTKKQAGITETVLAELFPEADFILLEGFKSSQYPKFEIVRKGNSEECVCNPATLLALITDTDICIPDVPRLGLEDYERAANILLQNKKEN